MAKGALSADRVSGDTPRLPAGESCAATRPSMEVEITDIPPLDSEELALISGHSLWNGYNVLRDGLTSLGQYLGGDAALLFTGLEACKQRVGRLRTPEAALADAAQLDNLEIAIDAEIEKHLQRRPKFANDPNVLRSLANMRSVSWILRVRARELLARAAAPAGWATFTCSQLDADFDEVLRAIEENSNGRYRIVDNLALQQPNDYFVNLKFAGARGSTLQMPPVFKDVMRDLIANARKYTAPGGQILAALHSGPEGLRFVVQDTGRGIPADEIPAVVHGGRRGSNVGDVRTMGGGFGLTKAFLVTKQFDGRLWLDSKEGRGTKVRIWLPPPPNGT